MTSHKIMGLAAIGLISLLLSGCVMSEKYEAEKGRSLNFQRLLAQEEKRTTELDTELKRVKNDYAQMEARNRELTAQIQAVREQLAQIQEEAAASRETASMRGQLKGKSRKSKKESAPAVAPVPELPAMAEGGGSSTHTVSAGETVYRIARQYGVSVAQIRQWNNLKNDVIEVGQQLVVAPPQ